MKQKKIIIPGTALLLFILLILIIRNFDLINTRKFIYPGSDNKYIPVIPNGKLIKIDNEKRNKICYFAHNRTSDKLIVFFHGNAGAISHYQDLGNFYYRMGYNILIAEYPGYGNLIEYNKTEKNIYEDCNAILQYIQDNFGFKSENTFGIGYSLGCGVAVEMAKRKLLGKIILVAPFTSIPDVGSEQMIPVLPYIFIKDTFNNIGKAGKIKIPVLIIHGKEDKSIPYHMSEKLNKKFLNSDLILIDNTGHQVIVYITQQYLWKIISKFLQD